MRCPLPRLSVLVLVSAALADPAASPQPSRDAYDRYILASVFETQVALCERFASETYRALEPGIGAWRDKNRALIQRLDVAAHRWRLPDDWKLDDILKGILASVTEEASKRSESAQTNECARVLQQFVSAYKDRWRGL